jgi:hypothetical protein
VIKDRKTKASIEGVCGKMKINGIVGDYRAFIFPSNDMLIEQFKAGGKPKSRSRYMQPDEVLNSSVCSVSSRRTGVTVTALCGFKKDPNGVLRIFRTFTDPVSNNIVEQFRLVDGRVISNEREQLVNSEAARMQALREMQDMRDSQMSLDSQRDQSVHKATKVMVIGGAVVAVIGAAIGVRYVVKSNRSRKAAEADARAARADHARMKAELAARPAELKDMPTRITLGADVPHGAGKTVSVSAAVPSSDVSGNIPRYRTSDGQIYIIQQNPNTSYLETLLLYDYLTRPYYFPHAHVYDSYTPVVVDNRSYSFNDTQITYAQESTFNANRFEETHASESPLISSSTETEQTAAWGTANKSEDTGWTGAATTEDTNFAQVTADTGTDFGVSDWAADPSPSIGPDDNNTSW